MVDPKLFAQAQQGDPMAIAALITQSLQSLGVWARAVRQDATLHIELEGAQAPDPAGVLPRLTQGMRQLSPRGIAQVYVFGFALGETRPAWRQGIELSVDAQGDRATAELDPPNPSPLTMPNPPARSRVTVGQGGQRRVKRRKPFVIKASDFEPMKTAVILAIAVYGFLGALNPSYDGPFFWIHFPNLAIHETGHLLFMPFGWFLFVLGGSLTQILFPAAFTVYFFKTQQRFASAVTLFWTGQNFMDVAVYIRDAPVRLLPLTVDNIDAHDWWQLLSVMGHLNQAGAIANCVHGLGVVIYLVSVGAGLVFARKAATAAFR